VILPDSLWRICGAVGQKAPQRTKFITPDLPIKSREAPPTPFMFQSQRSKSENPAISFPFFSRM